MKVNGDVDAIKECKACDWRHPTCYIVYKINNMMIIGNQIYLVGTYIKVTKEEKQ